MSTVTRRVRAALAVLGALVALVVGPAPPGFAADPGTADGAEPVELTLFWGDGCPRCAAEEEWLADAVASVPTLTVTRHEVWNDEAGRALFQQAADDLGFQAGSVPTTVVQGRVWIGFTDQIRQDLEAALVRAERGETLTPGVYGTSGAGTCDEGALTCSEPEGAGVSVDVPLVGEVNLGGRSLLFSTLVIGFVDGINPCSLWVISVLLTIVVRTRSRRRVVAVGTAFLLVTAGMYALYMAGIYSALTVVGYLGWIQAVVALVAAVFGAVSVKDYFAFKQGLSFTIKDSAKPGIYRRMREAAGHHSLLPALAATTGLAVAVSLLETPCTAGFPVLWTGLLKANGVGLGEAAALFVVYMVPFLLDEFVVFGVAVVTMRATKLQEKQGQVLKLVAGVTMLALAAVMAFRPSLMEDPVAALLLFAGTFVLAAAIHVVTVRIRRRRPPAAVQRSGVTGVSRKIRRSRPAARS